MKQTQAAKKENYVTPAQVADEFGVSKRTIDNWRKLGLPYYKVGGIIYLNHEEVMTWIKQTRKVDV